MRLQHEKHIGQVERIRHPPSARAAWTVAVSSRCGDSTSEKPPQGQDVGAQRPAVTALLAVPVATASTAAAAVHVQDQKWDGVDPQARCSRSREQLPYRHVTRFGAGLEVGIGSQQRK